MDAIAFIHHVPASWLRNSDLAPFIPAYSRCLIDQRYAASTACLSGCHRHVKFLPQMSQI